MHWRKQAKVTQGKKTSTVTNQRLISLGQRAGLGLQSYEAEPSSLESLLQGLGRAWALGAW